MNEELVSLLLSREPGDAVLSALKQLIKEDAYLLENDVNERSISHRFGMYLQSNMPEWHVDCEYNRDGVDPKRIAHLGLQPDDDDTESKTVFPDIIVHIRGTSENYLVIEFKKSTNTIDRRIDFDKLRGYKQSLRYQFALFVELIAGGKSGVSKIEWVDV